MDDREIYPNVARRVVNPGIPALTEEVYPQSNIQKSDNSNFGLEEKKYPLPKMNPKRKVVGIKSEQRGLVVGSLRDGVKDLTKVLSKVRVSGKWGLAVSKKLEYILTELSPREAFRPMSAERLNLAMKCWAYRVAKGTSLVTVKDTDASFIEKMNLCLENGKVLRASFSWLEYDSSVKLQQAVDSFLRWLTDCGNPVYLRTDGSRLCLWEVAANSYTVGC